MPMVQVHDELDVSVENEQQCKKIIEIMESCVNLEVPSIVDAELGYSWGDAFNKFDEFKSQFLFNNVRERNK